MVVIVLMTAAAAGAADRASPGEPDPSGLPPAELHAQMRRLYDALDYDRIVPFAAALVAHPDATVEQRLDAYLVQGSSLAIVGHPIEAEMPFRFLLRGRPDFDLPADTPPKILAVFRKVQVEERAIRDNLAAHVRRDLVRTLAIDGLPQGSARGGFPLRFELRLTDPKNAVRGVRVDYRRAGRAAFSSLALEPHAPGRWVGEIPGEWTADEAPYLLEYRVHTVDADGAPLLTLGGERPLTAAMEAGSVADATPLLQSWWFWGSVAVATTAVLGAAGAVSWVLTQPPAGELGVVAVD